MKVLHTITTINRGGAENHLRDLALHQSRTGHDVVIAYLKGDGYWTTELVDAGVHVLPLGLRSYRDLWHVIRLRRFIREFDPDLVHAHLPPAELYTRLALLGSSRRMPLVISKHNCARFFAGPGQRALAAWVARRADLIIAISEAVHELACADNLMAADDIVTIPYGIDASPYDDVNDGEVAALRDLWGIRSDELIVGSVARLVPQKALHILLRGFQQFLQRTSTAAKLVIVGQGPLRRELEDLARELRITDFVVWAGFREDIPVVMHAFDVFALTSRSEGFGLVLLEAMAAGRPVIATAVSAIPTIVEDGTSGFLVSRADPQEVANALRRCEQLDVRSRLGATGRSRVEQRFSLETMLGRTDAAYTKCVGAGAS